MCLGFQTAVEKEKSKYPKFHYLAASEMNPITVLESFHHRPDTKLVASVKDCKLFLARDMFFSNAGCIAQGLAHFRQVVSSSRHSTAPQPQYVPGLRKHVRCPSLMPQVISFIF